MSEVDTESETPKQTGRNAAAVGAIIGGTISVPIVIKTYESHVDPNSSQEHELRADINTLNYAWQDVSQYSSTQKRDTIYSFLRQSIINKETSLQELQAHKPSPQPYAHEALGLFSGPLIGAALFALVSSGVRRRRHQRRLKQGDVLASASSGYALEIRTRSKIKGLVYYRPEDWTKD